MNYRGNTKGMHSKTAIIIGAGPAGLTAAYQLLKHSDVHPIVLEGTEAIGGLSQTVSHNDNRMDIGGHRFFSKSQEVIDLWQEIMPTQGAPSKDDLLLHNHKDLLSGGPDPEQEDQVFLVRNRYSRIYYLKKFFQYPISLSMTTLRDMGLKRTFLVGLGYLKSLLIKKPEDSLENFYINRFGFPLYKMFFADYTEKLWGVHPRNIAASWGAQRVKGLSLHKAIWGFIAQTLFHIKQKETSLIDSFIYPKLGPGQFWESMANKILQQGGEIICNARVVDLQIREGKIHSIGYSDGNTVKYISADYVFSSMPISDLIKAMQDNPPPAIRDWALALPYRDFITVGLLVDRMKLQNETKIKTVSNIIPDCWIYIQDHNVKLGRLQIFNNWSPYMVKDYRNTVWLGLEYFCSEGDWMWNMPDEQFIEFAIKELASIGLIEPTAVKDAVRIRMPKAYPAYFGSYDHIEEIRKYLNSISNLYCIGRNGQHRYNNMDHSMLTAIRAVESLLHGMEKNAIWEVNTEDEYHEQKAKA